MNTAETITLLLDQILEKAHPLMAEALHMAAIPEWYNAGLLQMLRQRDDEEKNRRLAERMTRYSFIESLGSDGNGQINYTVKREERMLLQRHWIAQDPGAYRAAHKRALAYWEANPDPNPFAQAQNQVYHRLFVDLEAAVDEMVELFRAYRSERQLTAIERLLDTAVSTRFYLAALGEDLRELDDLLAHLNALLSQMRGWWDVSEKALEKLRRKQDLSPRLRPYVARAYGHALANTDQFVDAIAQYEAALALFDAHADAARSSDNLEAEKAYTMIALGDAHVGLALTARGFDEKTGFSQSWKHWFTNFFFFFLSLPLVLYLSVALGRQVWHPRFWPVLQDLDWLIARLFARGARYYQAADPVLERVGAPSEGVAADERLANLYLEMGDVRRAQLSFARLLSQEEAPLGDYRQATVRVGLAEALLRQQQHGAAREHLETAIPVLQQYEDPYLLATARALLAMTLQPQDPAAASAHFQQALAMFRDQNSLSAATNISERLRLLAGEPELSAAERETAVAAADSLPLRRYRTRFRHRLTSLFQRAVIVLLALTIFLIPISMFRLETGSGTEPQITFNATPLLQSNDPNFTPNISQGVSALKLTPAPNPEVLAGLGVGLFVAYLVLSTGIGLFIILRTPLQQVQATGEAELIQISNTELTLGLGEESRTLAWQDVRRYLQADISLTRALFKDDSYTMLQAQGQEPLLVSGNTAWYESINRQIASKIPEDAARSDLSYRLLYSRLGFTFLFTLLLFLLLALLGRIAPAAVVSDLPGIPYSAADLYPYLYLGLFVPCFWWFVLRPLQIGLQIVPGSRLPWAAAISGGILVILRLLTLFRPWFTVPDIYPTLGALLFVLGAAVVVWRARAANDAPVYNRNTRLSMIVLLLLTLYLMGGHLVRDVLSYHYLVLGNARRDLALEVSDPLTQERQIESAADAYTRAMSIAQFPLLGIGGQVGLRIPLGVPQPLQTTWLAARNSRAAMFSQLGQYAAAVHDYSVVLDFAPQPEIYVSRAIAYQGLGTQEGDTVGEIDIEREDYQNAIADLDRAIKLAPQEARYLLWRGVAYHALNQTQRADADYAAALEISGPGALTAEQEAQALTGRGWVSFGQEAYESAVDQFQAAADAAGSISAASGAPRGAENQVATEALLGLGYAYYSLRQYDNALDAWNEAADFNARQGQSDPAVSISLGTLHWRVATLGDDYESAGTDRCSSPSLSTTEKADEADELLKSLAAFSQSLQMPGQQPEELAYTYRTMGQVTFLLRNCPGYQEDRAEVLQEAFGFYDNAVTLDPDNGGYWYRKGRLAYSVWTQPGIEDVWLLQAIEDIGAAIDLSPQSALYWHDRGWMSYLVWQSLPAGTGVSAREWLFDGLDDIENALELDATDRNSSYRPGYWERILADEAITGTLSRGDQLFAADDYDQAQGYYALVAERAPDNARAAFKTGLAALAQEDEETAAFWYKTGLERAETAADEDAIQLALVELQNYARTANLDTNDMLMLFQDVEIDRDALRDADVAFRLALMSVLEQDYARAGTLYEEGLLLAAAARDINVVRTAADSLQAFLLENSQVDVTAVYGSLLDAEKLGQGTAVAKLQHPDLYWRYRAEFGFRLSVELFRQRPGDERVYSAIYRVIIADIERAYALAPDDHQVWRDFFVDANVGWLYLRRADDYYAAGDYVSALADYLQAAQRIQPDSANARGDLADAIFRAGLTALQVDDYRTATSLYEGGIALTEKYEMADKRAAAAADLSALLEENPDLPPQADSILEALED